MHLECTSCGKVYRLKNDVIPEGKTHVKCTHCQQSIALPTSPPISEKQDSKIPIQCTSCGTKYRVNRSKLGKNISKVKCTKCKTIFDVQQDGLPWGGPPLPQTAQTSSSGNQTSENLASQNPEPILSDSEKSYFDAISLEGDESDPFPEIHLEDTETSSLFLEPGSLTNKKRNRSSKADKAFKKPPPDDPSQSNTPFDSEVMNLSELPSISEPDPEGLPSAFQPSVEESDDFMDLLNSTPPERPSASNDSFHSLPIVEESNVESEGVPWGRLTLFLLLFVSILLGVGGLGTYYVLKEPSLLNWILNIPNHDFTYTEDLTSYRVKNSLSRQSLFIIETKLKNKNPTSDQISWIRFKGLTLDEHNDVLETVYSYGGNILSKEQLETLSIEEIKNFYNYNSGRGNSNFELKENQELHIQVVFFESTDVLVKNARVALVSYNRNGKLILAK